MKKRLIAILVSFIFLSCTNSGSKSSVEGTGTEPQQLEKITNEAFKSFVGTFTIGKFPWDVSETPLFADGEVPANFHEMSMEGLKKFINPDATESKGYYTGYAFFENEYIAIIYFYSYSSLFGGDNYHTSTFLLTFNYDGTLIFNLTLGESNTRVNPSAKRESQRLEGSIYADKITSIETNNFLEEEPNGSGNSLNFLIKPNGEIEQTETPENNPDQIAAEFEKAKLIADSLKQKFELEKHKMHKLKNSEWGEGGFSETFYFDTQFHLVYTESINQSGDDVKTFGYAFYGPNGTTLSYSSGGYPKFESLWVNQHFYTKEFDSDNSIKFSMREESNNDQLNNHLENIKKISRQEFNYNSDSSYYYREVGEGDKDAFDYKVCKISIDSLLFVHLFGDK